MGHAVLMRGSRLDGPILSGALALAVVLVVACTRSPGESVTPSQSTLSTAAPVPAVQESSATATDTPSAVLPSALVAAIASRAYVTWVDDVWAVGRYGSSAQTTPFHRFETNAFAAWGRAVIGRAEDKVLEFAIIDPATGTSLAVAAPAPPGGQHRYIATTDQSGETLYFHDSVDGFDAGLQSVDVASGAVNQLTEPSAISLGTARSWMHWSPSGNTLASTLCVQESCLVDLLDVPTGGVRRLAVPFVPWAITDRYMFGREDTSIAGSEGWAILDIAAGTVRPLPDGLVVQPNAIMALQDDRFLVDTAPLGQDRRDVVSVDGADGDHRVIFTETAPVSMLTGLVDNQFNPVPGLMLLAPGKGPGLTMIEVVANGTPLSVLTADGQLYENVIPIVR